MFCDLALLTFLSVVPNPWSTVNWPMAMQFRFDSFIYFLVSFWPPRRLPIRGAPLWRWASGLRALWAIGVGWVYLQPETHAALSERVRAAVGSDVTIVRYHRPRGDRHSGRGSSRSSSS